MASALLAVAGGAVAGAEPSPADRGIRELLTRVDPARRVYRVGLDAGHALEIGGSGRFRVVDPVDGSDVWKPHYDVPLQVVAQGGPRGDVPTRYRIQVGAFGSAEAARSELARLSAAMGVPGVVHHDPDRGNWRVRLGQADDRLGLSELGRRLREFGVRDFWIASEALETADDVQLRLVDVSFDTQPLRQRRLAVVPDRGARVRVGDVDYRGVIELRLTPYGTVRAINWIDLESYLRGVVPRELGPEVWPQIEALKAQAVAARTYAWRNRGQFAEEGFDLCATPRCQVYGGASAEHPMSDRAVRETRGQVLRWNSEPIVALYTATCGGHTEDGAVVFAEHAEPYLRGVPCRAEGQALSTLRGTLRGRTLIPLIDETGQDVTRAWAVLHAAGVVQDPDPAAPWLLDPLNGERLRRLTAALSRRAGLGEPEGEAAGLHDLGDVALALLRDLGWTERARLLLDPADLPALLGDDATLARSPEARRALGYLAWTEALAPFADGQYHTERVPTAARILPALVAIGERYHAFGLEEGVVSGVGRSSLRLVRGPGEVRRPLHREPLLLGLTGGRPVPQQQLEVWPGDRVRFASDPRGAIVFLERVPPVKGTSDDRTAAVYSWEVRKTRRQLEASINERVAVGKLVDLQVLRRGVSGRVAELRVVGSQAETVLRGFDVRRALELRESLTVAEIQRDAEGELQAVVFAGKGWGHGVGLCQVGAYGMALRGSNHREILRHYYRGAELGRIGP